jgi:phage baseplate assembly protein W
MVTPSQTYGILLPITHGPQGFFNSSYDILEQIKSNLNVLLRTRKGERRMNPEFGSGLWNILFENYTDDITPMVKNSIQRDIAKWMSYVKIQDIQIYTSSAEYKDKNKVGVKVLFTVPSAGINKTQTIEVAVNSGNI